MATTTTMPDIDNGEQSAFQKAGIRCPGDRFWLGDGAEERDCNHPLVGALINQTNLYFPRTISAIALPDIRIEESAVKVLRANIEEDPGSLGVARTVWNMGNRSGAVALVLAGLLARKIDATSEQVEAALESLFQPNPAIPPGAARPSDPESDLLSFRRDEFNIIRNSLDDPQHVPNLRVVATTVSDELAPWISRVNLVERLRETRAFYGFDRLKQQNQIPALAAQSAMRQLFRFSPAQPQEQWLPAIEVFGEGIYVELREDKLTRWQANNADWIERRLDDQFVLRLGGVFQALPPLSAVGRSWASRYLLVHSLAHILINQLVFECGYSTASLRERLYISADPSAPMAGFLLYTAAGDSDGTLGGLVQLGRPERLGQVMYRALGRASWCSADPVCSEHLGGQGSRLANLAACHACALLPETSCETINQGLDRAMVIGTPDGRVHGFMSDLLDDGQMHTLE